MDRRVKSQRIAYDGKQRLIAISDIHGNLPLLNQLLAKLHYDAQSDVLVLLGDLIEKGPHSLATLRAVMALCAQPNAYALMGNCDFVCKNVVHHYNLDFLKQVLCQRKESVLHEMAAQLGMRIDASTDMERMCDALLAHFSKELHWVDELPQVLWCDDYIFAHAGIIDEQHFGDDFREVLTYPHFLRRAPSFSRYVIVGHMPASEYCHARAVLHPIIDRQKQIVSIDGGNIVKRFGQLNAFLIQNGQFSYDSVDSLPTARAACDVRAHNEQPLFITWRHSEVERLIQGAHRDYCRHLYSGRHLWIDHAYLHAREGVWHADDFTTYQMPLCQGELVSIADRCSCGVLIKKKGVLGWCRPSHLAL